MNNELIKQKVLEENRIDILATHVFNYTVAEHHQKMFDFMYRKNKNKSLILASSGSGKTLLCLYVSVVFEILKNPNIRILIAANDQYISEFHLKNIKQHLMNPFLVDIFGSQTSKKIPSKESTITLINHYSDEFGLCPHFDLIYANDLVDVENCKIATSRDQLYNWFLRNLYRHVEDSNARLFVIGRRYHKKDLYSQLISAEFKNDCLKIPALIKTDTGYVSYWPNEKLVSKLLRQKKQLGSWFSKLYMQE